jgi:hypothetical protein
MSQTVSKPDLGVGDVVRAMVDGSDEFGIVIGHQPRMKPPRYLAFDTFDVLFYPGAGTGMDGMELNGCVADGKAGALQRVGADTSATFRERLESMASHGDLKERSLKALEAMRRRDLELATARGELEPMPAPHVVKPTLLQLVKWARVHWEDEKGVVRQGWVHDFGVWRDVFNQEEPAPRVSIESCRPGEVPLSMAMPDQVLLEKVLRATCFPDPSPAECRKCRQSGEPKGGEYPCPVCSRPMLHDPEAPLEQRVVAAIQARAITIADTGEYQAVTAEGRELLESMTPEERKVSGAAYAIREGHRRIRMMSDEQLEASAQRMTAEDKPKPKDEECRCPVRPAYSPGSMASGSAHETALLNRWQADHGHHRYGKARDELALQLQIAESKVRSGDAVLDMVADVFGMPRPAPRA